MISRDDNPSDDQELVRLRNENSALVSTLAAIKYEQKNKTLRDEFAMAALTGLLANPNNEYRSNGALISDAYEIADDAMKAREATK